MPETPVNKLQSYLKIAKRVADVVNQFVSHGSKLREADGQDLPTRDRVLLGLAIKAYNSFECLVRDAAAVRSEAFHHLKTLAETHMYFQWVGAKTEDGRAKLLLAYGFGEKIKLYRAIPELDPDNKVIPGVEAAFKALTAGLESEWKRFRKTKLNKIAEDTSPDMISWYNRIYKISCEPAHISDLPEHMPAPKGPISVVPIPGPSIFRSLLAFDFGLQIIFDLLRSLSEIYNDLKLDLSDLRSEFDAVRKLDPYKED